MHPIRAQLVAAALLAWFHAPAEAAQPLLNREPFTLELEDGTRLDAEQGTLVVPADRTRPGGGTVELYFVRIPGAPGAGPVPTLYLAGGPGGAATGLLRGPQAAAVVGAFRRVGDLVLLDQRGTGKSTPRPVCPPSEPLPDYAFVDLDRMLTRLVDAASQCAAEWRSRGVDLAAFNTREAADDLDDLRRALGAEKVNLVGFSYGTHLALATMRRHAPHLGRVVLIGTEGPAHTYKLPSTYDLQLRKLARLAAEDPSVGPDVPDMVALLERLVARLDGEPVTVSVRDRAREAEVAVQVSGQGLLRILRWDIGDGNDFVVFPAMLLELERGDASILARYVEKRWNQVGAGVSLMPIATDCASGASPLRLQRIRAETADSLFGRVTNAPYPEICAAVGNPDLGDEFRGPVSAGVPTLLVSGTLDSNTPPFQAEEVRWGLTEATHLVVENAGHEDTLPNPDVQRAIFEFLAGKHVAGRHIALPRPDFLSLDEARSFRP